MNKDQICDDLEKTLNNYYKTIASIIHSFGTGLCTGAQLIFCHDISHS
jgi:hypothetical protein